ncbi:hypothetical protein C3K47_09290 [Solitalea longa]|uniref:Fe/B12 periplasmic-binding domain-containing protein n=1 Tax=Solitalea longa TaxID=2079460 RepID=A0A2S5A2M3_9SPHI|nr:ABC transporter substrate-binding protein [Solitalea longa]POY36559.1 hypothetical protein C3K47_09290 [Solitalea longa]
MHNREQLLGSVSVEIREDLETRIDIIEHKLKYVTDKPVIAIVESLVPFKLAVVNNELVSLVGGSVVESSAINSWEDMKAIDPEIVVFALKGFDIPKTLSAVFEQVPMELLGQLFATKSNRLYIVNPENFYGASGAALVDHLELMAEIINPKQFYFGFEGEGWVKLSV